MRYSLLVMVLLLYLSTHAQLDQKKLDSLSKSIDSSAKAFRNWQDSFTKLQDSIYQKAIRNAADSSQRSDQFLSRQIVKEKQRAIQRIVIGVVLLLVIIGWLLKRRKTKA